MFNPLSSQNYTDDLKDISHEGGSPATGTARVGCLKRGESFIVAYREPGNMIGEGTTRAGNIGAAEAIDFFLREASNFDCQIDDLGELNKMTVYENRRKVLLGRICLKRFRNDI